MDEFDIDEQGRLDPFGVPDTDGDPATDPDNDEDAWLRSMPADLRAEVLARRPLSAPGPGQRDAELWDLVGGVAAFADGGFCDTMLPGDALSEMLAAASSGGYSQLSDDVLTGMLRAWQRQLSHSQSRMARLVAEIARRRAEQSRRPGWSRAAEHVTDELRVELTLTGPGAERLLAVASGLERLPEVNDALLSGMVDWARACVFVDELSVLDDETARQIADQLADRAAGWTTGQLRAALAHAVLAADPAAADRRKKNARKDTRVELWHEPSGNAALAGRELRPEKAIMLDRKLDSHAAWLSACGVPGSKDELRALAYTTLLSGRELASILADPAFGARAGADADRYAEPGADEPPRPGSIHLTMPVSTWLGGGEPGEVAGYGPADGQTSRELAGLLARDPTTRWCLTLTGAGGRAVAHACARRGPAAAEPVITWAAGLRTLMQILERDTCSHARRSPAYRPPDGLAHLVRVRQRTCAFPGCRRAAARCDLDHTVPFDQGGITCGCNLAPVCRRHHQAKQVPGWRLSQDQPGEMTWRLPSGRRYQTTGPPYPTG